MGQVFKTRVRNVGTSLGVLIPKEITKRGKIRIGEEVEIALLKRRKIELVEKSFGMAKGALRFEREHRDRS